MDFAGRPGKIISKLVIAGLIMGTILGGCYYDSVEALHPLNGYVNPCDSTQHAVYSEAVKTIMSYNCTSCHNPSYAAGNVTLDTYEQVRKYAENGMMMNAVLRKPGVNPMPPTQALPACQIDKLTLWINNNYPL